MNKGLFALAIGTFALGIAEFSMMGVLSDVAEGLDISISQAGHTISAYALGVAVGAPGLILLRKWPLRKVLELLALLIVAGNALAALAPGFHSLLVARFISGLPHGAYFGTGAIVAQQLVKPGKGASAVATMVGGMTVANLAGVPFSTFVCNMMSWRWPFAIVALLGLVTWIVLRREIPRLAPLPYSNFKGQFRFLRNSAPWLILLGTFFGQGSIYCWFSYVSPIMLREAHVTPSAMTWIMMLAGGGMVVGNLTAGKLADRYRPALVTALTASSALLILPALYFAAGSAWLSLPLIFMATAVLFGIGGPLQFLIVRYAKGGEMLGGACIQIAFNVSNAVASILGGAVIARGFGIASPALAGIPFAMIAAFLLFRLDGITHKKISNFAE